VEVRKDEKEELEKVGERLVPEERSAKVEEDESFG